MTKWEKALVPPDMTIKEVLERISSAVTQIALVVDNNRLLVGTVSDGDIRRALISGISLSDPVNRCMCKTPTVVRAGEPRESILAIMRQKSLHQIPIVDNSGRVVNLITIDEFLTPPKHDNWVVVMAGGPGTRLKELTLNTPKPMLSIGEKPLLETIISQLVSQGFCNIWISVNYHADKIETHFGDGSQFGASIRYRREAQRTGTAGALSLLPDLPSMPLLVVNADILTNVDYSEMLETHNKYNASATMAVREYSHQIPYGVVHTNESIIERMEEKPIHNYLVNAGIYVLSPQAVSIVPKGVVYDMTELFSTLISHNKTVCNYKIHGYWIDIGRHEDYYKALHDYPDIF